MVEQELKIGDCTEVMRNMESESVDLIVTDPPYGIFFMGKDWDQAIPDIEVWEECLRVLKPGAFAFIMCTPRQDCLSRMIVNLEDAGFETGFTSIYWTYGCLSEDTQILTRDGWEQYHTSNKFKTKEILCYDHENDRFFWEIPEKWYDYQIQDTCFRIKSDFTDQFVSRNHRVPLEREGRLLFKRVEEIREQTVYVPYLETLPEMQETIPDVPCMVEGRKEHRDILLDIMPSERQYKKIPHCTGKAHQSMVRGTKEKGQGEYEGGQESCVERRCDLFQDAWELFGSKICALSRGLLVYGKKGWICDGTPTHHGQGVGALSQTFRGGSSPRPRPNQQFIGEPGVICKQSRPQAPRTWKGYRTTLAEISTQYYEGLIFCPKVSSGCFVARRNGKIFITGNSGFPKAMNISKAVDKRLGVEPLEIKPASGVGFMKPDSEDWHQTKNQIIMPPAATPQAKALDGSYAGFQPKPAVEPIIVVMKPLSEKTYVDQALANRKGITWLDDCRIPYEDDGASLKPSTNSPFPQDHESKGNGTLGSYRKEREEWSMSIEGRFPANLLCCDDVLNDGRERKSKPSKGHTMNDNCPTGNFLSGVEYQYGCSIDDSGSFSRYYSLDAWWTERVNALPDDVKGTFPFLIVPKASKEERDGGLERFKNRQKWLNGGGGTGITEREKIVAKNIHPTVKPIALMSYLITLGSREGDTVLDPFVGSGTTLIACRLSMRNGIGIELNEEYAEIAKARIDRLPPALESFKWDRRPEESRGTVEIEMRKRVRPRTLDSFMEVEE